MRQIDTARQRWPGKGIPPSHHVQSYFVHSNKRVKSEVLGRKCVSFGATNRFGNKKQFLFSCKNMRSQRSLFIHEMPFLVRCCSHSLSLSQSRCLPIMWLKMRARRRNPLSLPQFFNLKAFRNNLIVILWHTRDFFRPLNIYFAYFNFIHTNYFYSKGIKE